MRGSLSLLPLMAKCLHHMRDDVERPTVQEPSAEANKGNLCHGSIFLFGNEPPSTPEQSEQFDGLALRYGVNDETEREQAWLWLTSWYAHPLSREKWAHEQAMAINVVTSEGRLLDVLDRKYVGIDPACDLPGTCDRFKTTDDEVWVLDNKFGRHANLTPIEHNRQLRGYAVTLCRYFKRSQARIFLAVTNDEGTTVTEHVLYSWDLEELADELRELPAKVPTAEPQPGSHCTELYCPIRATCKATRADVQSIVKQEPAEPVFTVVIESHEQIAQGLPKIGRLEAFVEHWKAAARDYVDKNGPTPLPDGRAWGKVPVDREDVATDGPDGAEAAALLATPDALVEGLCFKEAIETKTVVTKKAIEGVFRLHGKPIGAGVKDVMSRLRARGLTRGWTMYRYEAFKPRLPPKAKAS
jgi:hypothetical protein